MDPPGKYPIITVSTGLRKLTEILAWKRGWDSVSRVAATVLYQNNLRSGSNFVSLGETFRRGRRKEK